jgi:DNA-binding response OmpR family regulator
MTELQVLFVEDDVRLAQLTARYLASHGVRVTVAGDVPEGLAAATRATFDAILLDVNLPGGDGLTLCQTLRTRTSVPIIMVTARGDEDDRVRGLDVGADDYVTKPFSSRELLSRIRAVVRRARGQVGAEAGVVRVGSLTLEAARLRVTRGGQEIPVTAYEFAILQALAERAGRILNREQLLELAKGNAEEAFDRSIDVHVSRLRAKLGDDARRPRLLKTVRGVGYTLTADEGEPA